jgi:RimJ/RimL family protein N-acetyltransferase
MAGRAVRSRRAKPCDQDPVERPPSVRANAHHYLQGVAELGPVPAWPPPPIRTARLTLREPEALDRGAIVELYSSPEVGTFIGGPRRREDMERELPRTPARRPGLFVVDLVGQMIGLVTFDRRDQGRRGHVDPGGGEAELGYMFLPRSWGFGHAAEACAAALDWFADTLPGEPVVLTTQIANQRSMRVAAKLGFIEVERFEEYDAQQWFGVWRRGGPRSDEA